jgi:hypothetical protein
VKVTMGLTILSAGKDATLLESRNRVLISAGHTVVSATSLAGVVDAFFAGKFDAVVLCHSFPIGERQTIASLVTNHSPTTPVLLVSDMEGQLFRFGITVPSGPADLLKELHRAVKENPRPSVS